MNDDGPNPHFGQLHLNVAGRISHCHTMFLCLQLPLLHITGGTPDKLHYLDTRGEWKDAAGGAVPDGERTCGCVGATWARPRSGFPAPPATSGIQFGTRTTSPCSMSATLFTSFPPSSPPSPLIPFLKSVQDRGACIVLFGRHSNLFDSPITTTRGESNCRPPRFTLDPGGSTQMTLTRHQVIRGNPYILCGCGRYAETHP